MESTSRASAKGALDAASASRTLPRRRAGPTARSALQTLLHRQSKWRGKGSAPLSGAFTIWRPRPGAFKEGSEQPDRSRHAELVGSLHIVADARVLREPPLPPRRIASMSVAVDASGKVLSAVRGSASQRSSSPTGTKPGVVAPAASDTRISLRATGTALLITCRMFR